MRLTKKDIPELITKFAVAVRADEMRGAQPPEQHAEIINNYRETRSELAVSFHNTLDRVEKLEQELEAERAKKSNLTMQVVQRNWQDAERRLAEANALLDMVFDYVDENKLARLGQSRVKALIDAHEYVAHQLSRYSMDAGQADQRMRESRAVRKALGFGEDADDVSPQDLLDAIKKLKRESL